MIRECAILRRSRGGNSGIGELALAEREGEKRTGRKGRIGRSWIGGYLDSRDLMQFVQGTESEFMCVRPSPLTSDIGFCVADSILADVACLRDVLCNLRIHRYLAILFMAVDYASM